MSIQELLKRAVETVERLGTAAQDCKTCARLPLCNAYKDGDSYQGCSYQWAHTEEVEKMINET